jgi:hypothetical protein
MTHKRGRRNPKSQEIRAQWQAARQFVQEQAFFDRLKGEPVCLSKFEGVKKASSKNNSTYSLLDLFCFVASWSIFWSMRFESAMLTGCFA